MGNRTCSIDVALGTAGLRQRIRSRVAASTGLQEESAAELTEHLGRASGDATGRNVNARIGFTFARRSVAAAACAGQAAEVSPAGAREPSGT